MNKNAFGLILLLWGRLWMMEQNHWIMCSITFSPGVKTIHCVYAIVGEIGTGLTCFGSQPLLEIFSEQRWAPMTSILLTQVLKLHFLGKVNNYLKTVCVGNFPFFFFSSMLWFHVKSARWMHNQLLLLQHRCIPCASLPFPRFLHLTPFPNG